MVAAAGTALEVEAGAPEVGEVAEPVEAGPVAEAPEALAEPEAAWLWPSSSSWAVDEGAEAEPVPVAEAEALSASSAGRSVPHMLWAVSM